MRPFYVSTVVIFPTSQPLQRSTVGDATVRHSRVITEARVVVLRERELILLSLQEGVELTPTIISWSTVGEALAKRDSALVQDEVNVSGRWTRNVHVGAVAIRRDRLGSLDDLNIEAGTEGLHVGDDEGAVLLDGGGGHDRGELGQAEGGKDGHDVRVVGEVEVQSLVQREGGGVVVEGDVQLCGGCADNVVLETSEDLLLVADTDSTTGGRLEGVVTSEVDVDAVLVALPLIVGEETAE